MTAEQAAQIRQLQRDANNSGVTLSREDARRRIGEKDLAQENITKAFSKISELEKEIGALKKALERIHVTGDGHSGQGVDGMMFNISAVQDDSASSLLIVQDEGATILTSSTLNFVGSTVAVTNVGGVATVTITSTGGLPAYPEAAGIYDLIVTIEDGEDPVLSWYGPKTEIELHVCTDEGPGTGLVLLKDWALYE